MKNNLQLLNKKHTDTLIEQTKTKPKETFEFKMNKQMQSFSLSPPVKTFGRKKWLLVVTFFQTTKSVLNIIKENNSFSITTAGHWSSENGEELNNKLYESTELRSGNAIKLHLREVK